MTTTVQEVRGTSTQVGAYTGPIGQLVVDTSNNRVVVQDGATPGGHAAAKLEDGVHAAPTISTVTTSTTLTASQAGRLVVFGSAATGTATVTLPAASAVASGLGFALSNDNATFAATIAPAGTDTTDAGSLTLHPGDRACLVSDGASAWKVLWWTNQSAPVLTGNVTIGGTLTTQAGIVRHVRRVTSGPVTLTSADDTVVIALASAAATAISLPASPATGQEHTIKDGNGNCSAQFPWTITPAAGNIEGATTRVIGEAFRALTLRYDGAQWLVVARYGPKANAFLFTSSTMYFPSPDAVIVRSLAAGGGGGGGGGALTASGTAASGGAGGGGAACCERVFRASDLTSSVSITIGAGGTGGLGATTNSTAGANGAAGGGTLFGSYMAWGGGGGGQGGAIGAASGGGGGGGIIGGGVASGGNSGSGGTGGLPGVGGGSGGSGGASAGVSTGSCGGTGGGGSSAAGIAGAGAAIMAIPAGACGGGGGGGGVTAVPGSNNGANGAWAESSPNGFNGTGGTSGAPTGGSATAILPVIPGGGGGGGYGNASGTAGSGGGGIQGGGGGGGGSALNGSTSGNGGNGGGGWMLVIEEF